MYLAVTGIYWLSTQNTNFPNAKSAQSLITFTFVPVNGIVILPMLASSYRYLKEGRLKMDKFRNRAILLAVVLIIILIIEFFYFKDIQSGIMQMLQKGTNVVK